MPEDILALQDYVVTKKIEYINALNSYSAAALAEIEAKTGKSVGLKEAEVATQKLKKLDWLISVSGSFSSVESFKNAIETAIANAQTDAEVSVLTEELAVVEDFRLLNTDTAPGK